MKLINRIWGKPMLCIIGAMLLLTVDTVLATTLNVPSIAYPTIQAAINAAGAGDTIQVAQGTYGGNIKVNKSSITIKGDPGDASPGPGPYAPVIDGDNLVVDAFDLANGVWNVTITGFEIRNLRANAWTNGTGVGVQAWVTSTNGVTVSHNWFHNVGYGVMAGNDDPRPNRNYSLGTHTGWTVTDNVFEGLYSIGVELTDTSDSSVRNNVMHLGPAVALRDFLDGKGPVPVGPIGVFSWAHISEHNLTVSGNTIDGSTAVYPAIYIYASDDVALNPNLDAVLVENNLITSVGAPYQVYLRDIGTGTVTNARVTTNSLPSLRNRTAVTVDASGNWWGQATGPNADQMFGDVTTSPWISCYTDDPAHFGLPGFWPILCYTVSASVTGGHGSVSPASQTVSYGSSANISITPDLGYHIAAITDNGNPETIANPYVIAAVKENHVVVVAFSPTVPTNKDQCKNDGWKSVRRADGSPFKNQGDCVSYTNTGK